MSQTIIDKASEIIAKRSVQGGVYRDQYCALTLLGTDGYPTSSVITPSKADGIRQITFCTGLASGKVKRIRAYGTAANVCFDSAEYGISLSGDIEIVTDPEVKKEMWYAGLENHFSGVDDPNYCVLKFTTKRYNLFVDWQEAAGEL